MHKDKYNGYAHNREVMVEHERIWYPLDATERGLAHSPDGFNWGYAGSGPLCLGHSILMDLVGDVADDIYKEFTQEVIAKLPMDQDFTLDIEDDVRPVIERLQRERRQRQAAAAD